MSGPWKPTLNQAQSVANQIDKSDREITATTSASQPPPPPPEQRYQPIAPYGGIPNLKRPENRRVRRACDECRRKKIKCIVLEGSKSCKNCISYEKGCTYSSSAKKRGPPRGYIGTLENRLQRIEGLIDEMSTDNNNLSENTMLAATTAPISNKTDSTDDNGRYGQDHTLKKRPRLQLEDNNKKSRNYTVDAKVMLDSIRNNHLTSEGRFISGHNMSYLLTKMKILDKVRLSNYGIDVQHSSNNEYFHIKKLNTSTEKRIDQIRQLVELGVIQSVDEIQNIDDWIWRVAGIKKDLSDRLLQVYFAYIHPLLPVINKTAFLEEYRGIRTYFPSGPVLNAVYGAAVRYIENCKKFGDSDRLDGGKPWDFPKNLSEMLFQNLIIFIKGKYDPCLSTIQAIIIAHNHSANVESSSSSWLLNCIAVRMSQDIGLHRSSEGWNISQQEKETRRTVWWAVYILDRWFSSGTGRPLTAFDEDIDELYPSENVSLDEIMDVMTEKSQHLPRFPSLTEKVASKVTESFIPLNQPFLHLLKLSEILGQILQGLYTPQAKKHSAKHGSYAIVAFLDDALSKWRASLPPLLEVSSAGKRSLSSEGHVPILSMSGILCLSYCTLLILLYRPFIEKQDPVDSTNTAHGEKPKLSSQSALTICTNAAIRIVEVSESMHYRDFLMVSWGFALYPVFTAALIHIYNSSNPDSIVSDVAKSNLMRSLAVVDKLCLLSPMASSMGNILKKVISLSPVFVDDPEFMETLYVNKDSLGRFTENLTKLGEMIRHNPDNSNSKKPNPWQPTGEDGILKNHPCNDKNKSSKIGLDNPTSSSEDGNWIDQLYMPSQPNLNYKDNNEQPNNNHLASSDVSFIPATGFDQQHSNNMNFNNPDVYSIRQFGINTNSSQQTGIRQPSVLDHNHHQNQGNTSLPLHSQSLSSEQQQQQMHQKPTACPSPSTLFDVSDFSFPYFYGAPVLNNMNTISSNGLNYQQSTPVNMNAAAVAEDDFSSMFRNGPNNPFWNMPSSMEIDDWHAYLSPHLQKQQHK